MKVRFQADADFNQTILLAVVRKEPAIDFRSASEASLAGRQDAEVLRICAESGRTLVTHDGKTMPKAFGRFVESAMSPGVIVVPQYLPISSAVEDLLLIWAATDREEWVNRIARLPL